MRRKHDQREAHGELLSRALDQPIGEDTRESLEDMQDGFARGLTLGLTDKQLAFVRQVLAEHEPPPCENLVSSGKVKRGAEVPLPPALQNLPKRPPHRRHEVE